MHLKLFPALALHFMCLLQHSLAQTSFVTLDETTLPKELKYLGNLTHAVKWKDALGTNIVLRTETGIFQSQADIDNETNSAALYAYRYIVKKDSALLAWKVTDFVNECELDITLNFINDEFYLTDLDKDGITEVWLVYQSACRGDVSPADMKVIMYEGAKKYAMKGQRKIQVSETEVVGGEYTFDNSFLKGNNLFRTYAKKLWKKNLVGDPQTL